MPDDDYSEYIIEREENSSDLNHVLDLIEEMENRENRVAKLEEELKNSKVSLKAIQENQLPDFFQDMGINTLTLINGSVIEIQSKIRASIKKENRPAAFDFFCKNGHSGLLKHSLVVHYNAGEDQVAKQTYEELKRRFGTVAMDSKIHPSTLSAFVKSQLEAGNELPADLINVFEYRTTKIKRID